ncbi:MAG: T9SS type A sorting domain-containing protein [Candidatus Dadabacteria bacterium]
MKRLLLIVFIILLATVHSQAQQARFTSNTVVQSNILRFYPNPATTAVTFDFQKVYDKGYSIQIYNFLGRKMYEQTNIGERTSINLSEFTRGVYIYHLYDRNNKLVEAGKFQVAK